MNILHQSTTSSLNRVKGCKVCIITLDCGTELESDSLTLKSDRASCNATGAQRLDLQLDPPLYAFRPQLTTFTDINTAYDQLQNRSSAFPKVETPTLRPLQELKPVLPINQHVPKPSSLPTLNNYVVLENLHIPTRQHFMSTIIIALLVSLVVHVLFHYSPRIAAKTRTWRAARAARKAKRADASSPHADTSSLTELHAPSAPRLQHIQQPLSLPPVENILQLSPADRLAIICATAQPSSARQPPPPAYSSRTTLHWQPHHAAWSRSNFNTSTPSATTPSNVLPILAFILQDTAHAIGHALLPLLIPVARCYSCTTLSSPASCVAHHEPRRREGESQGTGRRGPPDRADKGVQGWTHKDLAIDTTTCLASAHNLNTLTTSCDHLVHAHIYNRLYVYTIVKPISAMTIRSHLKPWNWRVTTSQTLTPCAD